MDRFPRRHPRGRPPDPDVLTPAEWRVLEELRRGATNTEIAARLGLSLNTVKTHVSSMLAKLDLRDRHELAEWRGEPSSATRRVLARFGLAFPLGWPRRPRSAFATTARAAAIGAATAATAALGAAVIIAGFAGAGAGRMPLAATPTTGTPPPSEGWEDPVGKAQRAAARPAYENAVSLGREIEPPNRNRFIGKDGYIEVPEFDDRELTPAEKSADPVVNPRWAPFATCIADAGLPTSAPSPEQFRQEHLDHLIAEINREGPFEVWTGTGYAYRGSPASDAFLACADAHLAN